MSDVQSSMVEDILIEAKEAKIKKEYEKAKLSYLKAAELVMLMLKNEISDMARKHLYEKVTFIMNKAEEMKKMCSLRNVHIEIGKENRALAVEAEKNQKFQLSYNYYKSSIDAFVQYVKSEKDNRKKQKAQQIIYQLLERAEKLKILIGQKKKNLSKDDKILIIDPSELIRGSEIGQRTMGRIYKSKWAGKFGIEVTLKVVECNEDIELKSLENEIKKIKNMSHPLLVQIYGISKNPDKKNELIIVQEYMEQTLHDLIHPNENFKKVSKNFINEDQQKPQRPKSKRAKKKLEWIDKWRIIKKIIQAVGHLHSENIIHGDLKPVNFSVSKTNTFFSIKISDFSIPQLKVNTKPINNHYIYESFLRYMAPELIMTKDPKYSKKSDIFSLGMTIYEIVSGKIPFDDELDDGKVMIKIKYEDERPNIEDFPAILKDMVEMCWESDCDVRPTISELLVFMDENEKKFFEKWPNKSNRFSNLIASITCPITQEILVNPYITVNGMTYEYSAIKSWMGDHDTDPLTNQVLKNKILIPNHALRTTIEEWKKAYYLGNESINNDIFNDNDDDEASEI